MGGEKEKNRKEQESENHSVYILQFPKGTLKSVGCNTQDVIIVTEMKLIKPSIQTGETRVAADGLLPRQDILSIYVPV